MLKRSPSKWRLRPLEISQLVWLYTLDAVDVSFPSSAFPPLTPIAFLNYLLHSPFLFSFVPLSSPKMTEEWGREDGAVSGMRRRVAVVLVLVCLAR